MVVTMLPAPFHREQQHQEKLSKPEQLKDSEHTVEIGESFRSFSSFRRHSLQQQFSESSLPSPGCWDDADHSERRVRRITISCLEDLDMPFESSDRSFTPTPRLSLSSTNRRITTRRASDIYLRERRVSETMSGMFRVSMHDTDLLDLFQSGDFQEQDEEEESSSFPEPKGVSFGDVEIREYGIIPGDNPGGHTGAPITMEWDSFSCVSIKLARYEDIREQHRREHAELVIPASHRVKILMGLGFSRDDIRTASKKAAIGRKRRCYTLAKLRNHQMHERMERAKRTALNVVTLGYRSHAKRSYLKKHCPEHYQ